MNREKIIKNSGRDPEVLNKLNDRELFLVNLGDSWVPDLTTKIFERRFNEIRKEVDKERPNVTYYIHPACEYLSEMCRRNSNTEIKTIEKM